MSCVEGHAGCGTVALSGYDYHDGTRATGEGKDFTAGQCIGAALEYAHRKQRDLMVYVFSDGSVASNGQLDGTGKGIWRGDNSSTSSVFMLVYSPLGAPTLVDPTRQQIGYFRPDGSVETNATEVSNSPERLAEAIVLNYLALHGEENLLDQVLPNHAIGAAASPLDLVAFNRIR